MHSNAEETTFAFPVGNTYLLLLVINVIIIILFF